MKQYVLSRRNFLRLAGLATAGTTLAACAPKTPVVEGTGNQKPAATPKPPEKVKITVTDWYGADASDDTKKQMDAVMASFIAANPNVEVEAHAGGYDPKAYAARLAAGTLENVFAVWFTEHLKFIDAGAVADITDLLAKNSITQYINPAALEPSTKDGRRYGLPQSVYALGFNYNGKIFKDAGLDPKKGPQNWEEMREMAKRIKDKTGLAGFAQPSISVHGGWMMSSWQFTAGISLQVFKDGKWLANFTDPMTVKWLSTLKAMAFEDNSLQDEKLIDIIKVGELFGTGQVGMMMGGGVDWFVNSFKAERNDIYNTIPPTEGDNPGTQSGGYTYMFNSKNTPDQTAAGIQWVAHRDFNLEEFEKGKKDMAEKGLAVGAPELPLFIGEYQQKRQAIIDKYNNLPQENYTGFYEGMKKIRIMSEPPVKTQEMYAALDAVVQAAMTDPKADPAKLLEEAQAQFQAVMDAA